jgi:K+-sensing histidine kinase KdpD
MVPGAYGQADLEFLTAIASILAPLIENARLWSRLNQNYANALEALKITQARLIDMERTAAYVRLAQAMAHEIRNPLMVIGGLFRRLAKSDSLCSEEGRVQMIMTAVERVEMVLKEVDDFVKLPSMERKLHKIDLLIQDSIETHQQDWQQRNLNPVLIINSSNLMVPLDAQLFAKALTMIFKEIFASVPPGSVVKIGVDDSGSDVQIAFGEVNELESVCELFDPQLRSKPWSLGLFLNIAHKIIKDHGGRLLLSPQSSSAFPLIARIPRTADP